MPRIPSPAIAAAGLVGGYAVARWTKRRPLGGVVLAGAGGLAVREWRQEVGGKAAAGLTAAYVAAFAGSHPLAKKVGAWPAVFTVAGAMAGTSWAVTRNAVTRNKG
ncbi:hypothetical protein ACFYV5_21870 [Streptomyces sp. NPDC003035]|uniref:hypothetical protein n=1 Tax=Streptomyces sp. NPDC003035 TaxID=3364676 RepID=UPI00368D289E